MIRKLHSFDKENEPKIQSFILKAVVVEFSLQNLFGRAEEVVKDGSA